MKSNQTGIAQALAPVQDTLENPSEDTIELSASVQEVTRLLAEQEADRFESTGVVRKGPCIE